MAQNITLLGASYQNVPAVNLPKTGGGTARFTDVTDTTAAAADVASGKYFYAADGTRTQGTSSGGGGSSKAFQIDNSNHRVNTTGYTNTGAYLKVTKAGKYDIYWSAFRSSTSSGTNGTQWYKNGVAQGSAYTTWSNSYCQNPHVSGVTLAANDEIEIYARSSSNSRYCCVENLMIIEVD